MHHLEVELRDPYEGELDQSFYDELFSRAGGKINSQGANAETCVHAGSSLRFAVGDEVECNVGHWVQGVVVRLWYREPEWPEDKRVPYQVRLADGSEDLIYAPADRNGLIRRPTSNGDLGDLGVAGAPGLAAEGTGGYAKMPRDAEVSGGGGKRPRDAEASDDSGKSQSSFWGAREAAAAERSGGAACASAPSSASSPAAPPLRYTLRGALSLLRDFLQRPLEAAMGSDADGYRSAWAEAADQQEEEARTARQYRETCLYQDLFVAGSHDGWIVPPLLAALRTGSASELRKLITEVAPGIFEFEMLTLDFCDKLLAELAHYEQSGLPVRRPNSMNNYGVILNSIGMERTMDLIQRRFVRPIAALLFPKDGEHVDHHHSFMVQYKQGEDLGLDMHTDACDVTLNVCLGKQFTGAGLTFCGLRGDAAANERRFQYRHQHVKGRAIMHLGHHRHGADDLASGERFNLIMWNKSSSFRISKGFMSKYSSPPSSIGSPDLVCLSYTHDSDYEKFKPYPPGKRPSRERGG